ncbi:gluconate 2-dehydrogenase subunit 3 family protein [Arhodomonas sp. SL1]|uniref:gluconate 2-dehydrogenase subunit 3 family protein n=1 Tax=Arhodomonas sp. SL1 TaxID=3425691 RepID=UPI003F883DB0
MVPARREFLKGAACGVALYTVGGFGVMLTPRQARARSADLRVLTAAEAGVLEAYGEALLPGSAEAGLAPYVDAQLAAAPSESLLMIRYLDVPPPWDGFYRGALRAVDALARERFGASVADLDSAAASELAGMVAGGKPKPWAGPPAGFVHFVVRADVVDVVYGVPGGFDALGIPYMAHIEPEVLA